MQISDIVNFWRGNQSRDNTGRWTHEADRKILMAAPHSFNLDFPVSPYVGDIENAPVIILSANAGYDSTLTPTEFPSTEAVTSYVERVNNPASSDWSFVSRYYDRTNYGELIATGQAALINACAYRSPKLSQEPENRRLIAQLPSSKFVSPHSARART